MRPTHPSDSVVYRGFTLMELMVTISVFALMMTLLMQMMTTATKTSSNGFKHLDADTQARLVLDRMANDIAKMVNRSDVDYYFMKIKGGNDQLAFFSEATGYYPTGTTTDQGDTASLVGYRINNKMQLERLSKGLVWNGTSSGTTNSMVFLPQTIIDTWPLVAGQGNDPDYQVIGSQVFRFEYCFLLRHFDTPTDPPILADSQYYPNEVTHNAMADVLAIVVSIAVLDAPSQSALIPTALQSAAQKLGDVSGSSISPADLPSTVWKDAILNRQLGLPPGAAGQVRVYQRYCYLDQAQP